MATTFTIFFDGHLWVGVLEQHDGGRIRAARVVFGREPSGAEIEDWLRRHGNGLIARAAAAQPVDVGARPTVRARSPKRAQREAARQARQPRSATRALTSGTVARLTTMASSTVTKLPWAPA